MLDCGFYPLGKIFFTFFGIHPPDCCVGRGDTYLKWEDFSIILLLSVVTYTKKMTRWYELHMANRSVFIIANNNEDLYHIQSLCIWVWKPDK